MRKIFLQQKPFVLVLLCLLVFTTSLAQEGADRVLIPDQPTNGTIDVDNAAQIFTFAANAGDVVTLSLSSQAGMVLTMVLSDAQGANLGQIQVSGDSSPEDSSLADITLAQTGAYYVTVFPTAGTETLTAGAFILLLESSEVGAVKHNLLLRSHSSRGRCRC